MMRTTVVSNSLLLVATFLVLAADCAPESISRSKRAPLDFGLQGGHERAFRTRFWHPLSTYGAQENNAAFPGLEQRLVFPTPMRRETRPDDDERIADEYEEEQEVVRETRADRTMMDLGQVLEQEQQQEQELEMKKNLVGAIRDLMNYRRARRGYAPFQGSF